MLCAINSRAADAAVLATAVDLVFHQRHKTSAALIQRLLFHKSHSLLPRQCNQRVTLAQAALLALLFRPFHLGHRRRILVAFVGQKIEFPKYVPGSRTLPPPPSTA